MEQLIFNKEERGPLHLSYDIVKLDILDILIQHIRNIGYSERTCGYQYPILGVKKPRFHISFFFHGEAGVVETEQVILLFVKERGGVKSSVPVVRILS